MLNLNCSYTNAPLSNHLFSAFHLSPWVQHITNDFNPSFKPGSSSCVPYSGIGPNWQSACFCKAVRLSFYIEIFSGLYVIQPKEFLVDFPKLAQVNIYKNDFRLWLMCIIGFLLNIFSLVCHFFLFLISIFRDTQL